MANEIIVSGYIHNVKEHKNGLKTFGLSVSTKTGRKKDDNTFEYKSGFINVKTKADVIDKERVTIKGFITFDFWIPEGTEKEKHALKVYAMEVNPFISRKDDSELIKVKEIEVIKEEDNKPQIVKKTPTKKATLNKKTT